MSILPEPPCCSRNTIAINSPTSFSRTMSDDESSIAHRLFEKPLTPSDVGKLNRLVIPKQHAEKHFPLSAAAESGMLLGFEDELGKSWQFRYSYWNSSQSYVLTKGWSRFVKDKRLDAGDIVVFARHRVDADRFFIGWRRRNSAQESGGGWARVLYSPQNYQIQQQNSCNSLSYQPESPHAGGGGAENQTTSSGSGNWKRLRLFGVNLECHDDSEASTPVEQCYSSNHHMDMSFSGGGSGKDKIWEM